MSTPLRRLAMAGCALMVIVPAGLAAPNTGGQVAQLSGSINLLQIVTHIFTVIDRTDAEPFSIQAQSMEIIMAEAATLNANIKYDPKVTDSEYRTGLLGSGSYTYSSRLQCMNGQQMVATDKAYAGKSSLPDTGMNCFAWLKHSADVHRNPEARAADPEKDLLAPYREIVKKKGLVGDDATARQLVDGINRTIVGNPSIQNTPAAFEFTLFANQEDKFRGFPGMAFDAGFTQVVLDFLDKGTLPEGSPRYVSDQEIRACYSNTDRENDPCRGAGKAQGQRYLKTVVAGR